MDVSLTYFYLVKAIACFSFLAKHMYQYMHIYCANSFQCRGGLP